MIVKMKTPRPLAAARGAKAKQVGKMRDTGRRRSAQEPRRANARDRMPSNAQPVKVGGCIVGHKTTKPKDRSVRRFASWRLSELTRLLEIRYGGSVDTDDGNTYLEFAAHHVVDIVPDAHNALVRWAVVVLPRVSEADIREAADKASTKRRKWTADGAGRFLRVTAAERDAAQLTTIAAMGDSKTRRLTRRRARDRAAKAAARRARGAKTRREIRADSIARKQPWRAEGISRATWFRRRRAAESQTPRETRTSAAKERTGDDAGVSQNMDRGSHMAVSSTLHPDNLAAPGEPKASHAEGGPRSGAGAKHHGEAFPGLPSPLFIRPQYWHMAASASALETAHQRRFATLGCAIPKREEAA